LPHQTVDKHWGLAAICCLAQQTERSKQINLLFHKLHHRIYF